VPDVYEDRFAEIVGIDPRFAGHPTEWDLRHPKFAKNDFDPLDSLLQETPKWSLAFSTHQIVIAMLEIGKYGIYRTKQNRY
jgi:hypothetical protein